MKILTGQEELEAKNYLEKAAEQALHSRCYRSRCGSVIVNNRKIIGAGYNSPPLDFCLEKCLKDYLPKDFKSDKTCCVHAEQRAIVNALKHDFTQLPGSRLYFIRLNEKGDKQMAEKPYCTICSKTALDSQISEFVLWHKEGITVYDTKEYNELSFAFTRV